MTEKYAMPVRGLGAALVNLLACRPAPRALALVVTAVMLLTSFAPLMATSASAQEAKIVTENLFRDRERPLLRDGCAWGTTVCGEVDPSKTNAIILGDSHATDAYNALAAGFPDVNFIVMRSGGCTPYKVEGEVNEGDEDCAKVREEWEAALPRFSDVSTIVLQNRFSPKRVTSMIAYIKKLSAMGKRVIVMGVGPMYERRLSDLYDHFASDQDPRPNLLQYRKSDYDRFNADLMAAAQSVGGVFVDRKEFYCPGGQCTDYTRANDSLVVADLHHVTLPSAREFGLYLAEHQPDLFR